MIELLRIVFHFNHQLTHIDMHASYKRSTWSVSVATLLPWQGSTQACPHWNLSVATIMWHTMLSVSGQTSHSSNNPSSVLDGGHIAHLTQSLNYLSHIGSLYGKNGLQQSRQIKIPRKHIWMYMYQTTTTIIQSLILKLISSFFFLNTDMRTPFPKCCQQQKLMCDLLV